MYVKPWWSHVRKCNHPDLDEAQSIRMRSPTAEQYYIPVLALGTGAVFRFTIPERKHRIEGRRRLRLLDITF